MLRNEFALVHAYLTATIVAAIAAAGHRGAAVRAAGTDRGNITTQQVIWIAVGSMLAIGAAAIIVAIVMAKVNSIDLDTPTP